MRDAQHDDGRTAVDDSTTVSGAAGSADPAARARSVLSCPGDVRLVVDGVDDVLADLGELGMQDLDGRPTFSCPPDSALASAARRSRSAILTIDSALGAPGSPDRDLVLTLAGRVVLAGREACACCEVGREIVTFEPTFVLLSLDEAEQARVELDDFACARHQLNRGFLQRSVEHANRCHQDELRQAVSLTTRTRLADLVGVALADLRPHRVDVRWVDPTGARSTRLTFPRTARSTWELGELLREQLHAGLC